MGKVTDVDKVMDKVLIVDDDAESRDLLCEVLADGGYAPYAVADGMAAREVLLQDAEYRIVIADVHMPQESGLEFLRKLRQQSSRHEIILVSSFMSGTEKAAARQLGAHALLEKPLRHGELLQAVAEVATHNSAVPT